MKKPKDVAKTTVKIATRNSKLAKKLAHRAGTKKLKARFDELVAEGLVEDKTIMFMSFMGRGYSDSPQALYKEIINDPYFKDWKLMWAFKPAVLKSFDTKKELLEEIISDEKSKNSPTVVDLHSQYSRMELVKYGSPVFYEALAKTKYWITNSRLPEGIYPGEDNVYIQCWHGTPLKRLGADIAVGDNALHGRDKLASMYREESEKWSYLVSPSEFYTEKMQSAFSISADSGTEILEKGYPRNDYLVTHKPADIEAIKRKLHIPKDKKVLLYAPTWRDDQHDLKKGYTFDLGIDFDLLKKSLGDDWVILFRAHYFIANSFDFTQHEGFVYDASKHNDINELYVASDMLMTDYSSVFFDYSVLERPVLFFMYDKAKYADKLRGFYLDLDELPGKIVETNDEVATVMKDVDSYEKQYAKRQKEFNKRFCSMDDGKAARRVIDSVFKNK